VRRRRAPSISRNRSPRGEFRRRVFNSAQDHRDLARAIHGKLERAHPEEPLAPGELDPKLTYGEGFIGYKAERRDLQIKVDTQAALVALGYEIDIDGAMGAASKKAIRSFQQSQGLVDRCGRSPSRRAWPYPTAPQTSKLSPKFASSFGGLLE
jgi:hypothetical protein